MRNAAESLARGHRPAPDPRTRALSMSRPSESARLDDLCAALFTGPLAHWAGSLAFHDHPEAVPADRLADPAVFAALLDRFGRRYPGADRHAVASFWSQHYFARLTIPLTALCLAAGMDLGLDLAGLRVRFCAEAGTPLSFHLHPGGPARSPESLVRALYEEQVAATVAILKRHSGLSARLFWENAGSYGIWILGELARTRPDTAAAAERLLADVQWPRAGCAMLSHIKGAAHEARPTLRRVCCLRYRLPGVGRCAGSCPLPAEADAAT